jgi:hypothetical protein
MNSIIIEDAYNSSYLTSTLVSLFYNLNDHNKILLESNSNPLAIYLQELIIEKFLNQIKKGFMISSETINEIRNYLMLNNFDAKISFNNNDDVEPEINEIYEFLINFILKQDFSFVIEDLTNNNILKKFNFNYINLIIDHNKLNTSIRDELEIWYNKNIFNNSNNSNNSNNKNIMQSFSKVPNFIGIKLNKSYNTKCDIMKRIKFGNINNSEQTFIRWKIHSIILKNSTTNKFYSLVKEHKYWIKYTEGSVPSFEKIYLEYELDSDKYIHEAEFLFYVLDI